MIRFSYYVKSWRIHIMQRYAFTSYTLCHNLGNAKAVVKSQGLREWKQVWETIKRCCVEHLPLIPPSLILVNIWQSFHAPALFVLNEMSSLRAILRPKAISSCSRHYYALIQLSPSVILYWEFISGSVGGFLNFQTPTIIQVVQQHDCEAVKVLYLRKISFFNLYIMFNITKNILE